MSVEPAPQTPRAVQELAERRRRLTLLGVVFGLGFASIGLRLLDMVDWRRELQESPSALAPVATAVAEPTPSPEDAAPVYRAEITDRNGELLATNVLVPSLYLDPSVLTDREGTARKLASTLSEVDEKQLLERFRPKRHFAWVKHQITPEEQRAVLELGIPGIGFKNAPHRVYPKRELTSHVVGFVNIDSQGLAGVERAMDDRLSAGASKGPLALGLDLRVQQIVREELFSAFVRFRAKGASAIVLDTATGEVLSMVSLPDFDPNHPDEASDDQRLNRNTGGTYELGSLLKVFTSAMALDSGTVPLTRSFDATQPFAVGRHLIHDDHAKRRWLSVPECFMYSSNICMAQMAFAAGGAKAMQPFFEKVGFLEKPDIELPQAELGNPQIPKRWPDITVATASFGHGIAISPFQYVSGMAGLVSGPRWVKPTLLRREPGDFVASLPSPVSARTEADLRWLLWLTVQKGTGEKAKQANYLIGGKTGTADKPGLKGQGRGYHTGAVLASFIGVFPVEAPRYLVLVLLDEPHGDASSKGLHYAAWTAAPVVGVIVDRIGPLLGVRPSDPKANDAFAERLVVTKLEGRKEERLAALGSRAAR